MLSTQTTLTDVTQVRRRSIGAVYRAVVTIAVLYRALKRSIIRYSPLYQRGFKPKYLNELTQADYEQLLPLNHPKLQLNELRAQEMAVKFLQGKLYTSHITWNARCEPGTPEPKYDPEARTLTIETDLTVPDTGHRHLAYYFLGLWKEDPSAIPDKVVVNEKDVTKEQIVELLGDFDPETESVYCDVYTLPKEKEGELYDEFNSDVKPPQSSVAIDLNPKKTPARRFVKSLMDTCSIFGRNEIETRSNTIGTNSRKLTTIATLEGATRPHAKRLAQIEENEAARKNLLEFFCEFFREWALLFPAIQAGAKADARNDLREQTFAVSNVMFHPLFRVAFELGDKFQQEGKDWHHEQSWRNALRKLGGEIQIEDNPPKKVGIMSRDNPAWRGKILIERRDAEGKSIGWQVNNTRASIEAAYNYICSVMGVPAMTRVKKRKKDSAGKAHEEAAAA